jgi:hypothetical protein
MPDPTKYPDGNEGASFLRASGMLTGLSNNLMPDIDAACGLAIYAAVAEWERLTRYQPFLASSADSTRLFDVPTSTILDLMGGIVTLTSVSVAGSLYTAGRQYTPGPSNAVARGKPYTYLDFGALSYPYSAAGGALGILPGLRQSIQVTGTWGFSLIVPPDVRLVILREMAATLAPSLSVARFGGLVSWTEAGVTENYGKSQYADIAEAGSAAFQAAALRYRRLTLG